jgi:hypothetical protein
MVRALSGVLYRKLFWPLLSMTYGRLCDYLISTDSYVCAGVCVGGMSHRHDIDSLKIGRHNRMLPTCRVVFMSATDKNVCCLRGGADRYKSRHCQPRAIHWDQRSLVSGEDGTWGMICHDIGSAGVGIPKCLILEFVGNLGAVPSCCLALICRGPTLDTSGGNRDF